MAFWNRFRNSSSKGRVAEQTPTSAPASPSGNLAEQHDVLAVRPLQNESCAMGPAALPLERLRNDYESAPKLALPEFAMTEYQARGDYRVSRAIPSEVPDQLVTYPSTGRRLSGRFSFSSNARVSGHLEGEAFCAGTLYIGVAGRFEGILQATRVVIAGVVRGQVHAERVEVLAGGVLDAELGALDVVVHEGATVRGPVAVMRAA